MNPLRRIIAPGLALIIIIIIGIYGYHNLLGWSFIDSLYMVVITFTTAGWRDVHVMTPAGRIFDMFLVISGIGIAIYTLGQFVEMVVEGEISGYRRRKKMEKKISEMKDHYIICGYGRVGHQVSEEFNSQKVPFVVIDTKVETATELGERNIPFIIGNITFDENLEKAGIKRAKGLIAAADSDTDNVFVTISARVLNPAIYIVARAGHAELENKLKRAGADRVISPYFIAGKRMAGLATRPIATDFFDRVMHGEHLEFEMRELAVSDKSPLSGKTLKDLDIRQKTGANISAIKKSSGEFDLQPVAETKINAGDVLISLGTPKQLDKLQEIIK